MLWTKGRRRRFRGRRVHGGSGGSAQNATVSGPYAVTATSSKNGGITDIYANFVVQSNSAFSATQDTLVCPANDPTQCTGDDPPTLTYTLTGTVSGNNVQMTLQFRNTSGPDTATVSGTLSGTSMSGSYPDTQGDSGNWTATQSASRPQNFSGTINSTLNPLQVAPPSPLS